MGFQVELLDDVVGLLRRSGGNPQISWVPNPDDASLVDDINIEFGAFRLWIYEDGANIGGPSLDKRFEIYDYGGLEQLRESVMNCLEYCGGIPLIHTACFGSMPKSPPMRTASASSYALRPANCCSSTCWARGAPAAVYLIERLRLAVAREDPRQRGF